MKKYDPGKIRLERTCEMCPEQYDAFYGARKVGYLRLRRGVFSVDCPGVGGETVLMRNPAGEGSFEASEREFFLGEARAAIAGWMGRRP